MNLLIAVGGAVVTGDKSVSISPSSFNIVTGNGSYTTPFFTATPVNFVDEVTYLWEVVSLTNSKSIPTLTAPTEEKTRVSISGSNSTQVVELTCTITDGVNTESAEVLVNIDFGSGGVIR